MLLSIDMAVFYISFIRHCLRKEFEVRMRLFLTWELNNEMLEAAHLEAEAFGASRLSDDRWETVIPTTNVSSRELRKCKTKKKEYLLSFIIWHFLY